MSKGVDVYTRYQKVIDWGRVQSAGYEFAYVKVSDGTVAKDTADWGPRGRAVGIHMGAYHYAQPGDPIAQANLLCNLAVSNELSDLAPALDLEAPFTPNQSAVNFAVAFLRQVRARGFRPALYGNQSMMNVIRGPVLAAIPETYIWIARYGANPTGHFDLWQHSQSGQVPGIYASAVDLNTGVIPLNTVVGGGAASSTATPNVNQKDEERTVIAEASNDDYIVLPTFGGRKLFVGAAYGRTVNAKEIWAIGASKASGGNYLSNGAGQVFAADRPGPIMLPEGTVSVTIRYSASHAFTAWVTD